MMGGCVVFVAVAVGEPDDREVRLRLSIIAIGRAFADAAQFRT